VTTERLYYTDSYLTSFRATVAEAADGGRKVYLDRTAFYPTSGGQPFDTGRLGSSRVTDVVDEGERIAHLVDNPLGPGPVEGSVDWDRRFDHMQQHTGQHLLSAVLTDQYGYRTVSVHFGTDVSTLDLETGSVTPEEIRSAEAAANRIVAENRLVSIAFEDAALATGLRKASERAGTIRVVTIADLDRSACGGTHVRATGEIGAILIRRVERVKKQIRLEFVCGARAIGRARADFELLSSMAGAASAAIEDLPALLEKLRQDLKTADLGRREVEAQLNLHLARDLYHQTSPDATGVRRIVQQTEVGSLESLRGLAQAVTGLPKAIFLGTVASPPTLLVATSEDSGIDAGALLKPVLAELGGRGGGSARAAQGTVPSQDALDQALARLDRVIGGRG